MSETLIEFGERMFVGPVWPASILACLLVLYTVFAIIGLIDFEMDLPDADAGLDVDVDLDADLEMDGEGLFGLDFTQGIGAVAINATNFGRVPIVIWGGIFTVAFWSVSYGMWHGFDVVRYSPSFGTSSLLVLRNMVIAVGICKAATQPLLSFFEPPQTYGPRYLIGATCEVSTLEATPESGQAKFRTDAAPLLLNVRTDGPHLSKGDEARIIGFDAEKGIYKITSLESEKTS